MTLIEEHQHWGGADVASSSAKISIAIPQKPLKTPAHRAFHGLHRRRRFRVDLARPRTFSMWWKAC